MQSNHGRDRKRANAVEGRLVTEPHGATPGEQWDARDLVARAQSPAEYPKRWLSYALRRPRTKNSPATIAAAMTIRMT
jgi:hypothetical protein